MILDHYGFLNKLQKMNMKSITGKDSSSKNAKVSYDQVVIAAYLPKHPVFWRRLSTVELRKESQHTRLSA